MVKEKLTREERLAAALRDNLRKRKASGAQLEQKRGDNMLNADDQPPED